MAQRARRSFMASVTGGLWSFGYKTHVLDFFDLRNAFPKVDRSWLGLSCCSIQLIVQCTVKLFHNFAENVKEAKEG